MASVLARTPTVDSDRSRKATKGDREAEALESKDPSARLKRRHVGNGVNPNRKADEDRRAPWHGNDGTRVGNSPTAEPNRASRSVRMRTERRTDRSLRATESGDGRHHLSPSRTDDGTNTSDLQRSLVLFCVVKVIDRGWRSGETAEVVALADTREGGILSRSNDRAIGAVG